MSPSTPANPKKEKILVIEGDGTFAEKIVLALEKEGYVSMIAKNSTDGLKTIYDTLPRLIILDTTLADGEGYNVLEKKHAEPLLQKIPVFLISSQGQPIDMQKVPQGSVAEFIISYKEDVSDIIEKVKKHFNRESTDKTESKSDMKKILWVEDDKLIGSILSKKLTSSGFDLFHANNGEEAVEMLTTVVPDVIVLDLLLPGMSGFDILKKVKEDNRLQVVPVMILSNMNKPSDIERAKILGVKKYLVKAANSLDQIVIEIQELSK